MKIVPKLSHISHLFEQHAILLRALQRAVDAGIGSDGKTPSPADEARDAIAKSSVEAK